MENGLNYALLQASVEKNNKTLQGQLSDMGKRITEGSLQLNDLDANNKKCVAENAELLRVLDEIDGNDSSRLCTSELGLLTKIEWCSNVSRISLSFGPGH